MSNHIPQKKRSLTERLRSGFGGLVPPVCDEAANEIERLRAALLMVRETKACNCRSPGEMYDQDCPVHGQESTPDATSTLRLPDDPRELFVTTARDAGFSTAQWKSMFYESGPYDVTFPCFTMKKFVALLLERLQPVQPVEPEDDDE